MSSIIIKKDVPVKMNEVVSNVISKEDLTGFEKAYLIASAIGELKQMLSPEYMKPIMNLQGSKLGFKTDKTYSEIQVKEALIEAVFLGVQPYGNEFNIIAGQCYLTKEGLGAKLKKIKGLSYSITPSLPRIKESSAAIVMNIEWSYKSITKSKDLDIPIRVNKMMGTDAIIGKATRKARYWLYSEITGSEVPEGSIDDVDFKIVPSNSNQSISEEKEKQRIKEKIESCKTIEELDSLEAPAMLYGLTEEFDNEKDNLIHG